MALPIRFVGSCIDKILVLIIYIVSFFAVCFVISPFTIADKTAAYLYVLGAIPSNYFYTEKYIIQDAEMADNHDGISDYYWQENRRALQGNLPHHGMLLELDLVITISFILLNILYYLFSELLLKASFGKFLLGGIVVSGDRILSTKDVFKRAGVGALLMLYFVGLRFLINTNYYVILVLFFFVMDLPLLISKRSLLDVLTESLLVKREFNSHIFSKSQKNTQRRNLDTPKFYSGVALKTSKDYVPKKKIANKTLLAWMILCCLLINDFFWVIFGLNGYAINRKIFLYGSDVTIMSICITIAFVLFCLHKHFNLKGIFVHLKDIGLKMSKKSPESIVYKDYYMILSVDRNATQDQIDHAFMKELTQFYQSGGADTIGQNYLLNLNEAYKVIGGEHRIKTLYDIEYDKHITKEITQNNIVDEDLRECLRGIRQMIYGKRKIKMGTIILGALLVVTLISLILLCVQCD